MKKQTGIWLDSKRAFIVKLVNGKEIIAEIESDIENRIYHEKEGTPGVFTGSQHINQEKKLEERKMQQTDRYLSTVWEELKDADELYIFGPAEMKVKLKQKIKDEVFPVLKSVETADSMTDRQIIAQVKKFFAGQAAG